MRCETVLRSALPAAQTPAFDLESLSACEAGMAGFHISFAARRPHLSADEKRAIIDVARRILDLVRLALAQQMLHQSETRSSPVRSRLTMLENDVRLALGNLQSLESWSATSHIGAAFERLYDGTNALSTRAGLDLTFDHGNQFDSALSLALATPLREESGFVRMPPRSADLIAVTQAWLSFKRYRNVRFKLGVFPDAEGLTQPKVWPFISVQGQLAFVRIQDFHWELDVRHDFMNLYSPLDAKPKGSRLERTRVEILLGDEAVLPFLHVKWGGAYLLHWYVDPDGRLPSLSLGRPRVLDAAPAAGAPLYRISELVLRTRVDILDRFAVDGHGQRWWNFVQRQQNEGWHFGFGMHLAQDGMPKLSLGASRSRIECASAPPVHLASHLLPGTEGDALHANADFVVRPAWNITLWQSWLGTRNIKANGRGCRPEFAHSWQKDIPRLQFGTTFRIGLPTE